MVAEMNVTWEQAEDLVMHLVYTENGTPVDLTDYEVRMDVAPAMPIGAAPILSLNSADHPGVGEGGPLDTEGEADNEVSLDSNGNINIVISRFVTMAGGVIGDRLSATNKYVYDIFVRDTVSNRQKKLAKGTITVNKSVTLWQ